MSLCLSLQPKENKSKKIHDFSPIDRIVNGLILKILSNHVYLAKLMPLGNEKKKEER
jgi:hypothetical protein